MEKTITCPACRSQITAERYAHKSSTFYLCPVCGRFELFDLNEILHKSGNQLAPYLLYHRFSIDTTPQEYRYHTPLEKETCDEYKKDFNSGNNTNGWPVHMDAELINAWYPKTFSEKIDLILLHIYESTAHMGQFVTFKMQELFGMLFIDRKERIGQNWEWRDEADYEDEANYMLDYLRDISFIEYWEGINEENYTEIRIRLTPKGYERVDELQKNTSNGRNVLVAMKFGEETKILREAIRQGITNAGYFAVFIDEVQHNDFITPELLKYIRDSKFVVVDLTHQNNGAYFEEGYAMGIGKPVIQLCKKDTYLHFDIAQKNTIIWDTETSIPLMLKNRINATID